MTKSEFARHINVKPGYVTQLHTAGRLVMEGSKVDVEASVARIEATRDPSKAGVAARHEQARVEKLQDSDLVAVIPDGAANINFSSLEVDYQREKALRERANRELTEIELKKVKKKLIVADDARQAVMDGDVLIRSRLESLPDMLAPQLAAETDEQRVRAMLIEQIEQLLAELSSSFHKLTISQP